MLQRLVLFGHGLGAPALGPLALELCPLELLGGGLIGHAQNVAPIQAVRDFIVARLAMPTMVRQGKGMSSKLAGTRRQGEGRPCHHRRVLLGIDHVQVAAPVGSEGEARRFYGELLGLPEIPKPSVLQARGGVWFACGTHQLHVGISDRFSPADKAHPALQARLADLDRLAARLEEAGAPVGWDDAIPDTRRFYTADPWGNRIELVGTDG